jgi:hypothetical protein
VAVELLPEDQWRAPSKVLPGGGGGKGSSGGGGEAADEGSEEGEGDGGEAGIFQVGDVILGAEKLHNAAGSALVALMAPGASAAGRVSACRARACSTLPLLPTRRFA